MEPGIAEKAIEQFTEVSNTILELAKKYKKTIGKWLDGNNEIANTCNDVYTIIIECLQRKLDNSELLFEDRKYYLEQMKDIA